MDFKSKMKQYQSDVDIQAWQAMDILLDDTKPIVNNSSSDAVSKFNSKFILGVGLIAIVLILGYLMLGYQSDENLMSNSNGSLLPVKHVVPEAKKKSKAEFVDGNVYSKDSSGTAKKKLKSIRKIFDSNYTSVELNHSDLRSNASISENVNEQNANEQNENVIREHIKDQLKIVNKIAVDHTINTARTNESKAINVSGESMNGGAALSVSKSDYSNISLAKEDNNQSVEINRNERNENNLETYDNLGTGEKRNDANDKRRYDEIQILPVVIPEKLNIKNGLKLDPLIIIEPNNNLSRYYIGLDIGVARNADLYGESYSMYRLYQSSKLWRFGLRFNYANMREPESYEINPEVKRRKQEYSANAITQFIPLTIWNVKIGVECGIGFASNVDKRRVLESNGPNELFYTEETITHNSVSAYMGSFITYSINNQIELGVTGAGNIFTENINVSGRVLYKFNN